jgi:hypothetical protein
MGSSLKKTSIEKTNLDSPFSEEIVDDQGDDKYAGPAHQQDNPNQNQRLQSDFQPSLSNMRCFQNRPSMNSRGDFDLNVQQQIHPVKKIKMQERGSKNKFTSDVQGNEEDDDG